MNSGFLVGPLVRGSREFAQFSIITVGTVVRTHGLPGRAGAKGGEATRRHHRTTFKFTYANLMRNGTVRYLCLSRHACSPAAWLTAFVTMAARHYTLPRLQGAAHPQPHVRGSPSVLCWVGTPAALRSATIAVRPRRSATSRGERPSLSLVATLAPRAKSSGTTRSMPAAAARCKKLVA